MGERGVPPIRRALAIRAQLAGEDLYYGTRTKHAGEWISHSYHASGVRHTKVVGSWAAGMPRQTLDRFDNRQDVPLAQFAGIERLLDAGLSIHEDQYDWSYKVKPDSPNRETCIVPMVERSPYYLQMELHLLEAGRGDLAAAHIEWFSSALIHRGHEVVWHRIFEWSPVWLFVMVWTMRHAHMVDIMRQLRERDEADAQSSPE